MTDLLVVVDDVAEVVSAAVVRLSDAHRVVREVDIAVVAEEFGHLHCSFARGCACSCGRRCRFGGRNLCSNRDGEVALSVGVAVGVQETESKV